MKRFQDKRVIVTGAGQGIGFGICRAFAAEGAVVLLNDLDAGLAESAAQQINQQLGSRQVYPFAGDVAFPETCFQMVEAFTTQHGAPDIVVANAGITRYIEFLECTPEMFDHVVGVNLRGTYFLAQSAAKKMIQAQQAGRILVMSSVVGLRAYLNFSVYSMTKAGLAMLAKSMALELGPHQITVNAISPGATLTERTQREDPNYAENWATVSMNGRVGWVEDIVAASLFLASPEASHITGQNLVVDGGWTQRSPIPEAHPDKPIEDETR